MRISILEVTTALTHDRAQHWLEQLDMIQEVLYHEIDNGRYRDLPAHSEFKLAVLSTGIDAQRPVIRAAQNSKRLLEIRDFTSQNNQGDPGDDDGHGTDNVVSILRMTRYANIYVGKVGGILMEESDIANVSPDRSQHLFVVLHLTVTKRTPES